MAGGKRELVWVCLLAAALGLGAMMPGAATEDPSAGPGTEVTAAADTGSDAGPGVAAPTIRSDAAASRQTASRAVPALPGGGRKVFGRQRFLVAYYGTAGTGVLGVLGESDPDTVHRRLVRAAKPFARQGARVQPVYELIVTVADAVPGPDGDYHHDIARHHVQTFIDAAERNDALLVLDIQPGRADFLSVAKRWTWALEHPWVGLALDPEWRMGPDEVPGRVIGSVSAAEVNRVSAWLDRMVRREALPEKVFMLHQFRSSMIRNIGRVKDRSGLAEVQHIDGFGTPGQKRVTYRALARPDRFAMGYKLFYDEDTPVQRPRDVRRIRPRVRFVSYQ